MFGEIKIIGGRFKGKKIKVYNTQDLRPTPARVREALFNILQHDIPHATCLDAYAGTGALGLEAYSRGAQHITFIEKNPKAYQTLLNNISLFPHEDLLAIQDDCENFLNNTHQKFDIIFLDPPFRTPLWEKFCTMLVTKKILKPQGLVYLEAPFPIILPNSEWHCIKQKKVAEVFYSIYRII